jgi:hypothetical protein
VRSGVIQSPPVDILCLIQGGSCQLHVHLRNPLLVICAE